MTARRLLILLGLITAAVGTVAIVAPGAIRLADGSTLVTVLGGVMVLRATQGVLGADAGLDEATTGDPERRRPMPRPGDREDLRIAGLNDAFGSQGGRRKAIRDRVTRVATDAVARTEGLTRAEARERIDEEMDATRREYEVIADLDDGEDVASGEPRDGLGRVLRRLRPDESSLQRRVRRAVDAVGRRLDMPPLDARYGYPDAIARIEARLDPPTRDGTTPRPERGEEWTRLDDGVFRRERRQTGHWTGMGALALGLGGVGVVLGRPPLLLSAAVGIGFAAYRRHAEAPGGSIEIDRSVDPSDPGEGEAVTVTLTVRNGGEQSLPDLRVVDGVPERLEVVSGSPRLGTSLRPGETVTLTYGVLARRGPHEFGSVTVLSRDESGAVEDELVVDVETTLTCVPALTPTESPAPLRDFAVGYVGRAATERGSGVEFDSVREYRPGDPLNRIDWNRYARDGDLATLRFREGRSTTVYLLVDARAEAYLAPDDGEHAVDRCVRAAGRLFATLASTSTPVGIAALGTEAAWLDAGVGEHHRHRAEELLGRHPAFDPLPPATDVRLFERLQEIRARLPGDAQVVFLTPMCDGVASFVARRIEDRGHPVTVLSPDPTAGDTVGGRLVGIERRLWTLELVGAGIRVVDWGWDEPLEAALQRALSGDPP